MSEAAGFDRFAGNTLESSGSGGNSAEGADAPRAPSDGGSFDSFMDAEPSKVADAPDTSDETADEPAAPPLKSAKTVPSAEAAAKEVAGVGVSKEPAAAAKVSIKAYKATVAGKTSEFPLDAKFAIPLDKGQAEVSLEDLVKEYNGKTAWDKKFTELDKGRKSWASEKAQWEGERTKWEADRNAINEHLSKFVGLAQEGKSFEAWQYLVESAGLQDKINVQELRKQTYEQAQKYFGIPEHERKLLDLQEERDFLRSKHEALTKRQESERTAAAQQAQLDKLIGESGLSKEDYNKYRKELLSGGIVEASLKPSDVVEYKAMAEAYTKVGTIFRAVNPDLLQDDERVKKMGTLVRQNPDIEVAQFVEWMKEDNATERAAAVSETVRKQKKTVAARKAPPPPKHEAVLSWDDI